MGGEVATNINQILLMEEVQDIIRSIIALILASGLVWFLLTIGRNLFAGVSIRGSNLYRSRIVDRKFKYKNRCCILDDCKWTKTRFIYLDNMTAVEMQNLKFNDLSFEEDLLPSNGHQRRKTDNKEVE